MFSYVAFWVVTLAVLRLVLPEHVYEPVAGISIQLLWILGALRAGARPHHHYMPLVAAVAGSHAFVAVVDAVRINTDTPSALGYLNRSPACSGWPTEGACWPVTQSLCAHS